MQKQGSSGVRVLKATAQRAPRPPKSIWTVDLELTAGPDGRWFVLSDPIENAPEPRTSPGVKLLEATAASGAVVRMVRFSSTPNLLAFWVAPGAVVRLTELKLQCWAARGVEALEVHGARDVLVSGASVTEGWLKGHAVQSPVGGGSLAEVGFGTGRQVLNHLNPDFAAEPVTYQAEERWRCALNVEVPWPEETPEEISAIVQLSELGGGPRR
jgi:hypothetical protein